MGFSWDAFYEAGDWDRGAYVGGADMTEHLESFLAFAERDTREPVESVASVGCGPAKAEFEVAERRPDVEFVCYDAAPVVVDANREKAAREGVENVTFDVAALPDTGVDRRFDVVYCMAVLYFVEDAPAALRELWQLTAPSGFLAFTYPNRRLQAWARTLGDDDHDKKDAFRLVADGENLLSYDRIQDVLGTYPRNYWTAVDADPDADYVQRSGSPAVYVRKPA